MTRFRVFSADRLESHRNKVARHLERKVGQHMSWLRDCVCHAGAMHLNLCRPNAVVFS